MLHYNVPTYDSVTEFLAMMAKKRGLLKKKGIPDAEKAARMVLNDWNRLVFWIKCKLSP